MVIEDQANVIEDQDTAQEEDVLATTANHLEEEDAQGTYAREDAKETEAREDAKGKDAREDAHIALNSVRRI
jgi:hypothetical protein